MRGYLLDTCTISEPTQQQPRQAVLDWLARQPAGTLWISVATVGEVRSGIERLEPGRRRFELETWSEATFARFGPRVLAADQEIFRVWGRLTALRRSLGHELAAIDGIIAATALVNDLTVATRDIDDFTEIGVGLFDPWMPDGIR
jgi:predicted nucleic acid-binding protein